jgi:hypothetical protein
VSGAESPVKCNGNYTYAGDYGGYPYYKHDTENYWLWYDYDIETCMITSDNPPFYIFPMFVRHDPSLVGDYVQALNVGSVVVTVYSGGEPPATPLVAQVFLITDEGGESTQYAYNYDYVSVYPPAQNSTYVTATSKFTSASFYWPYFVTDPTKPLIGDSTTQWVTPNGTVTNQRFHIDLGKAKIVKQIYYENYANTGSLSNVGAKNFILQGSNTDASFANTTYATNTGWDNLTTDTTVMAQHVDLNQPDPKYITVTNTTAYRYYALKFANTWGNTTNMGIRRIELQTAR